MAKDRRIVGGYYNQYDGKMFFVVTVAKGLCNRRRNSNIFCDYL